MRHRGRRRLAQVAAAAALAAAGALQPGAAAEEPGIIFRATCGAFAGHRVDMNPADFDEQEPWRAEHCRAGAPPEGQGAPEFLSDDAPTDSIRVA